MRVYLTNQFAAQLDQNEQFAVDDGVATFLITFEDASNGDRYAFDGTNVGPLTGTYDQDAGIFTLVGHIDDVDHNVDVELVNVQFSFSNRPPVANAGGNRVIECNQPYSAHIHLSGDATTDPDGAQDLSIFTWFIDPGTDHELDLTGEDVDADLSLGAHTGRLVVFDKHGSVDASDFQVVVQDTTPPAFVAVTENGVMCLAPPNHDYAVFDLGTDISALVTDVCDPNPSVEFVSATSNQPDNSTGDGNTNDDVVLFPQRVCLRAERQGVELSGREYTLEIQARDASGNTADPTVTIAVAHDQRNHDCPPVPGASSVDTGDPECTPAPDGGPAASSSSAALARGGSTPSGSAASHGCSHVGLVDLASLLMVLVILTGRRSGRVEE